MACAVGLITASLVQAAPAAAADPSISSGHVRVEGTSLRGNDAVGGGDRLPAGGFPQQLQRLIRGEGAGRSMRLNRIDVLSPTPGTRHGVQLRRPTMPPPSKIEALAASRADSSTPTAAPSRPNDARHSRARCGGEMADFR
jgi:hypothetical protein